MPSASTAHWPGSPQRGAGGDQQGLGGAASWCNATKAVAGIVKNKRNTSAAALHRSAPLDPQPDDRGGNDDRGRSTFRVALGAALQQRGFRSEQAKYKRGRVAPQRATRSSTGRPGRK